MNAATVGLMVLAISGPAWPLLAPLLRVSPTSAGRAAVAIGVVAAVLVPAVSEDWSMTANVLPSVVCFLGALGSSRVLTRVIQRDAGGARPSV